MVSAIRALEQLFWKLESGLTYAEGCIFIVFLLL